ncbi:MAG: SURF1 family protein, partial [Gemmatimonadota bacterium]
RGLARAPPTLDTTGMRTLELTPAGILGTIAVLVVVAVCVRLGLWQLDRREQRLERNAMVAERLAAAPVELEALPPDTAGLTYRRAAVRGRFDNARAMVLAGRSHAGAPGAHVLVPLRLGDGALLVNRGWLPAPDAASVDLDPVVLEGRIAVEGVLLPFPDVELETEAPAFQRTWFRFDGDAMRQQLPYPAAPLYLVAERLTGPGVVDTARPLPVMLEPPALDPGPHLSYALQWFSFAAIFLVGWAVLLVRRPARADPRTPAPVDPA